MTARPTISQAVMKRATNAKTASFPAAFGPVARKRVDHCPLGVCDAWPGFSY